MRPVRHRLARAAAVLTALGLLAVPATAAGFDLADCSVTLTSRAADGSVLGTASGPGAGGTMDDPVPVERGGTVEWQGSSGSLVFDDWSWGVSIFYLPTPIGDSGTNDSGGTDGSGTVAVGDVLPFDVAGLVLASGQVSDGDGDRCQGEAWFEFTAEPIGSIPFLVGLGLLVLGAIGLFWGFGGSIAAGVFGGLLAGLGLAVLAIVFGLLFLGGWTPAIIALAVTGLGTAVSISSSRARARGGGGSPGGSSGGDDPVNRFIDEQLDATGDQ